MADASITEVDFKKAVSQFITGVTVLSTYDDSGVAWGMTANSFSSVSLRPPLISVCIARSAGSFDVFARCEGFSVSILSDLQEDIALRCASPIPDKFEGLKLIDGPRAFGPMLDDAAATLTCELHSRVDAGDHQILIGRVVTAVSSGRAPLGYFQRSFFSMLSLASDHNARRQLAGWLFESEGRLLLQDSSDGLLIPTGAVPRGNQNSLALGEAARRVCGFEGEIGFLYSVVDVPDVGDTCFIYRGSCEGLPEPTAGLRWIRIDEVSMDSVVPQHRQVVSRYLEETTSREYSLYLDVGDGMLADISNRRTWSQSDRGLT